MGGIESGTSIHRSGIDRPPIRRSPIRCRAVPPEAAVPPPFASALVDPRHRRSNGADVHRVLGAAPVLLVSCRMGSIQTTWPISFNLTDSRISGTEIRSDHESLIESRHDRDHHHAASGRSEVVAGYTDIGCPDATKRIDGRQEKRRDHCDEADLEMFCHRLVTTRHVASTARSRSSLITNAS